jgi:hypothetical protein
MKTCVECGGKNEDQATKCSECGAELAPGPPEEAGAEERLEQIAVLDGEVQAELADALLSERQIPHLLQSYHDSAYDGIFQVGQGWGRILAPPEFKDEILGILEEIKRQADAPSEESETGG